MTSPLDQTPGLAALTTLVRDCSISGVMRRVLLLRTDMLPPQLSRPHHLRLAAEAVEPLLAADRARRYDLSPGRLAISWRGDAAQTLQHAMLALEHLLMDAPLDAPSLPQLARVFELPRDGAAVLAIAVSPAPVRTRDAPPPVPGRIQATAMAPMDLALLERIEKQLATADVARFTRRRQVCRIGATTFTPAWEKRLLDIRELMAALAPGHDGAANPWLFRRLTRSLDRRMLSLLSNPNELRGAGAFSLDLNVGGVLSPAFLRFDSALPAGLRGQAILGLDLADVMRDVPAYRFAAAFARERGYRVLLRGLTPLLLSILDVAALAPDFVELIWSPEVAALEAGTFQGGTFQGGAFQGGAFQGGPRWVLARANTAASVAWCVSSGIGLCQGDAVLPGCPLPTAPLSTAHAA